MENILKLKIITPNKIEYDDYIISASLETIDGITVLQKNYAPTIGSIVDGKITINTTKEAIIKIIGKGCYSIANNNLEILTSFCLDDTDENINFIEEQKNRAIKHLSSNSNDFINFSQNFNINKIIQQLRRK